MPELEADDVTLHVEVDGSGDPVTVFAHGITNNCTELSAFTPLLAGTKVRFDFRGHGQSSSPPQGAYRFKDFARDVQAVADAYGATRAVGTSLGAGAICHWLLERPDRFERLVFLLPAGLDRPFRHKELYLGMADLLERVPLEEAVATMIADPARRVDYERIEWLEEFDRANLMRINPIGVPRAIRDIVDDWPVQDREMLSVIEAPTLLIAREGDVVHPMVVATELLRILPNAELMAYETSADMIADLGNILARVTAHLTG